MTRATRFVLALFALGLALAASACAGSSGTTGSLSPGGGTATGASGTGPGALQAEANSAAAGDIPDNQVFLVFRNPSAGYSMKYPEGWAQQGSKDDATFRDKNNIVRVVVTEGPSPTVTSVKSDIAALPNVQLQSPPQSMTIGGSPAIKVVYSTESAPNSVTGKRVKLVVDRYYLWKDGRVAVVDLGTPEGVDNVDAYRLMIESFRWS
jgi:hypothetical protein